VDFKNLIFGAKQDPKDERDYQVNKLLTVPSKLASSVDWTDEMTPVKDQANLGSCVAFAVCAVKEWQEKKEWKTEIGTKKNYDMSEQFLYYKCKEIDKWPDQEGTSFRYAMKVLSKNGVPVEIGWQYDPDYKGKPEKWAESVAQWYRCGSYWRITTLEEMKTLLALKGPQVAGILCFNEIFNPNKDAIITMPSKRRKSIGGHAICLVGYDDSASLLKFKNSWGTAYGENGYAYISYDYYKHYCLDAWYFADTKIEEVDQLKKPTKKALKPKQKDIGSEGKIMKIKLINKLKQLQEVHILRNGRDTTVYIPAGHMITLKPEEISEDIKMRIQRKFLEKK